MRPRRPRVAPREEAILREVRGRGAALVLDIKPTNPERERRASLAQPDRLRNCEPRSPPPIGPALHRCVDTIPGPWQRATRTPARPDAERSSGATRAGQ